MEWSGGSDGCRILNCFRSEQYKIVHIEIGEEHRFGTDKNETESCSNDLWVKVIKGIHGPDGVIESGRRLPRGGVESSQFNDLMVVISDVVLSDSKDEWKWTLDSKCFYVASARKHIDEHILNGCPMSTRWSRCVPIKVNVFMWRLRLDKLPTLMNMDCKGIDVDSFLCLVCREHVESVNRLFFSCGMARDLWVLLARWCDQDISELHNIAEWLRG
nr:RNA-directed DNA polymerase, eukaryota, reverse transcriptase zinc-binding domain protein [Tanacetum cinerariifolium]